MANGDENTTPDAPTEADAQAPAKKKTAKKSAKKASKKATKKTAKKSRKRTAKPQPDKQPEPLMDRSQIGEKTRVFSLAKTLGMSSKDLVTALAETGLNKVAQSSLTRAETEQLLDTLEARRAGTHEPGQPAQPEQPAQSEQSGEQIRRRVRKNVENEINQIEEKVEQELELVMSEDDLLTDSELTDSEPDITPEPDITSEPEDEDDEVTTGLYEPVFKAAPRSNRRRASRSGGNTASHQATADPDTVETDTADTGTEGTGTAATGYKGDTKNADDAETTGGAGSGAEDAAKSGGRRRNRRSTKGERGSVDKRERTEAPEAEHIEEPKAIKGSSRLEAQRRRRSERREEERKRSRVVSQAEFLARRESVERTMVVRERDRHDGAGRLTQVGVLEDGLLVEHFVDSDDSASLIGNIYLGRVQNVLPSMEAAFIDIGTGRNGVLYAGEVDWKAAGLGGRSRRIEQALKSGDQVIVQVTKDPVGHKGARLTTQISLAGRFLVYVPGGRSAGISRKLPAPERKRLKDILVRVVPGKGGAIIRTAAEGAPEEAIAADVNRLHTQWEAIQEQAEKEKNSKGATPVTLYEEPKLLVKVVRDLFNEDFDALVVDGKKSWTVVNKYVESVAPDLQDRLERFNRNDHDGKDAFEVYRVDEQIQKALSRTVWLPSGGTLVIDRTEAMTVIDVNTGKFTGSGGSLEETVTSNNMEAAEEIVRQLRLRDLGGMIIIDFIDMILPENQELVLRRLKEALGRDRTRHQVSEVTSLGLVQLTRKRLGTGLVETFSTTCECCDGRGIVLTDDPVTHTTEPTDHPGGGRRRSKRRKPAQDPANHPAALAMQGRDQASEADVDALVDAIVVDTSDDMSDAQAGQRSDEFDALDTDDRADAENADQPKRRSSRRRGRRGSGRGKGRAQAEQASGQSPQDTTAHASEQEDDSEHVSKLPTAQTSTAQTYEEAVEEFENSPRRKRKTRGNSKSDHRPRREDFEQEAVPEPEDEVAAVTAHADGSTAATDSQAVSNESGASDASGGHTSRGGRGRRRATRRTTKATTETSETGATGDAGAGAAGAPGETGAAKGRAGAASRPRRSTRRRGSARSEQGEAAAQKSAARSAPTSASTSALARGRRRATRKGTS